MREDMFTFIINFLKVFSTKTLVIVIGFLNSVLIARGLGVEGQGQYALALTIYTIGFQFINMGLHSAHTYYLAKDKKNLSVVFGNTVGITIVNVVICLCIILFIDICNVEVGVPNKVFIYALLIMPCYLYFYLQYQTMLVMEKIAVMSMLDIAVVFLPLIGNIILIMINRMSVYTVLGFLLGSYLLADLFGVGYFTYLHIKPKISIRFYKKCIKLGIIASLACFLGYLVLRADILMVQSILGTDDTGIYSLAENLVEIVNAFGATCTLVMFPKATAIEDKKERYKFSMQILKMISLCMLAILVVGEILGGFLIPAVYGDCFNAAVPIFRILLVGIVFWGIAGIPISYYATEKEYGISLFCYTIAFVGNIVMNYMWIPKFGIIGAAGASVISYFVVFLVTIFYFVIRR